MKMLHQEYRHEGGPLGDVERRQPSGIDGALSGPGSREASDGL